MTPSRKFLPADKKSRLGNIRSMLSGLRRGYGFWSLVAVLALASFISLYDWVNDPRMYVLGEVADSDIAAAESFYFQDLDATRAKRDAVRLSQPLICTLDLDPAEDLNLRIREILLMVDKADSKEDLEKLRQSVSDEIGEDIQIKQFQLLQRPEVQNLISTRILPWIMQRMRAGVVSDTRVLGNSRSIIVRGMDGAEVSAGVDASYVSGVRDVLLDLSIHMRGLEVPAQTRRLLGTLATYYMLPTMTPNLEATTQSAHEASRAVRPVVYHVSAGEVIVRQGEKLDAVKLAKLQAMFSVADSNINLLKCAGIWILAVVFSTGFFFKPSWGMKRQAEQKELLFIACTLCFTVAVAKGFYIIGHAMAASSPVFTSGAQAYAVPAAGAAGLIALASGTRRYYISSMLLALFCALANKGGLGMFLYYFTSALLCTWLVADTETRKEVVRSFLALALGLLVLWLGVTLAQGGEAHRFTAESIAAIVGAFLSMVFVFALSPLAEILFGFTTRFALMELMNQSHPLLQMLMFNAPGTHHHSMIVASMVEQAAKAIGANSLLGKTAALYHDVGKIHKPEYFIENQFRMENPHDRITPAMSALVLISHVKQGGELARKYKLGREIADIVTQHHGNRVIPYFYHKAKAMQANVRMEDFRYSGPKPQTREAALIMLADVVEASGRTMGNPTPNRIRIHVHKMLRNVLAEGQLNAVELTFRELEQVEESFIVVLTGFFHKRIEYPGHNQTSPAGSGIGPFSAQGGAREEYPEASGFPAEDSAGRKSGGDGAGESFTDEERRTLDGTAGWVDVDAEYERNLPQGMMVAGLEMEARGEMAAGRDLESEIRTKAANTRK